MQITQIRQQYIKHESSFEQMGRLYTFNVLG